MKNMRYNTLPIIAAVLFGCLAGATAQTDYRQIFSFDTTDVLGANPQGNLIHGTDGALYGTTSGGGSGLSGTIFKIERNGSGHTVLRHFLGKVGTGTNDGSYPVAGLLEGSNGELYGTTVNGGSNNVGTVFRLNKNGSSYTTLHHFLNNSVDGQNPSAGLVRGQDGALYGTTVAGGANDSGTVFKLNTNGAGYAVIKNFSGGNDGAYPYCRLVQGTDGGLYGTTSLGGSNSIGTVFRLSTNAPSYTLTTLFTFSGTNNGNGPAAGLIQGTDGLLYGTTEKGGSADFGTVFKLKTNGTSFSLLHEFLDAPDGTSPKAGLIQATNGMLYGTTFGGGTNVGPAIGTPAGTVFKLSTNGSGYTILRHLINGEALDGYYPQAQVIQGRDGAIYGASSDGGSNTFGCLFVLGVNPVITAQPQSRTVLDGTNVTLNVAATGLPTPDYQWLKNGTNIAGATNTTLAMNNVVFTNGAIYAAIVSNPLNTLITTNAVLTVYVRPVINPAGPFGYTNSQFSFYITGGPGQSVVVKATTNFLDWVPVWTNTFGVGPLLFIDLETNSAPFRFYRANLQ